MPRLLIPVLNILARGATALEYASAELARRLAYCPDCGRNRYYGAPCAGTERDV